MYGNVVDGRRVGYIPLKVVLMNDPTCTGCPCYLLTSMLCDMSHRSDLVGLATFLPEIYASF